MYGLCMDFGVHTALFGLIQSGSVTEAFQLCWRTGQSTRLETILFRGIGMEDGAGLAVAMH